MYSRPIHVIAVTVAAVVTDCILLLFAVSILVVSPMLLIVCYSLLIASFCVVNLWTLYRTRRRLLKYRPIDELKRMAGALNIALPAVYYLGSLDSGIIGSLGLTGALAVTVPSLLNWLAIEKNLRFNQAVLAA